MDTVLKKEQNQLDPNLKEKFSSRAIKAEEDIGEDRTMTREEIEEKLNAHLGL